MPDQDVVQQVYETASRLIDESKSGHVDLKEVGEAIGRSADDSEFYGACQDLKRRGKLTFDFEGGMRAAGIVRRP